MAAERALSDRVAEEVRVLMTRRRITQETLAEGIGLSPASLSRRLAVSYPFTIDEVERIASYFNVSPASLLGLTSVNGSSSWIPGDGGSPDGATPHPALPGSGFVRIRRVLSREQSANGRETTRVHWVRERGRAA